MSSLDSNWYRVAPLVPRLRSHAVIHRHVARGRVWHVLQDQQTGRFFRVSPAANLFLCLMDGRRSVDRIFALVAARHGAERPTQAEVVKLLVHLHQADLLHTPLPPDMAEVARRAERNGSRQLLSWVRNPMAMRFPLVDPESFLAATAPAFARIPGALALAGWLGLVALGIGLAALHWDELSANVSDRVLAAENLLLIALIYPVAKALHELGHAYAARLSGGEVHEMGVMLLVFFPVPYVDASASSAFPEAWRRIAVAGAGMMVEMALAALAMLVWVAVEPGLVRAIAFNVVVLCSVSTVLFNGNPLLRFDGYYILCDLLGIPNLDARAKRYLLYLAQRHGFGLTAAESPVQAPGEAFWFVLYGVSAFLYRLGVMVGIALLVSTQFFVLGIIMAAWGLAQMCVWPLLKGLGYVLTGPEARARRGRAIGVTAAALMVAALALFVVRVPYASTVEGVVWVPEEAALRARGDGFFARLVAEPGSTVAAGDLLVELEDPVAAGRVEVLRAELAVLESRYLAANLIDRVQAKLIEEQREHAAASLARAEQRLAELVLRATRDGRFIVPEARRLGGRFLRKGDLIGYIVDERDVSIRVVVPQAEIDLVRQRTRAVAIRHTERIAEVLPARVVRETPAALERVPAPGLASEGGGPMVVDPTSANRERPLDRFYEIELTPLVPTPAERLGGHVFARFDHGAEPIAWRGWRYARQLLLRALDV